MTPFVTLHAMAAPMPDADIDTDIIFPARFLLLTHKAGLGVHAFHDLRFDARGNERPGFVLHRAPWRGAGVLVAGANFGCGSSREQAPWALIDLGLRCIVAPSFGDIFHANCIHNGLLPVTLAGEPHAAVMAAALAGQALTVSLLERALTLEGGRRIAFELPERPRQALLRGHDEITRILIEHGPAITDFEARQRQLQPWLHEQTQEQH
jgi:3-isopropylmalate dehydratase small subunit